MKRIASNVIHLATRSASRMTGISSVAVAVVTVLALAATLPTAPATVLADSSTHGGSPAGRIGPRPRPAADLTVTIVRYSTHLEPGEPFSFSAVVKNEGSGTAKPVRVLIGFALPFTDVRVLDAPAFRLHRRDSRWLPAWSLGHL